MVASLRWPGLSAALYGSAFTYGVMSSSACSWLNVGTSMSFSPTTSGTEPARMAVASWLVSSLGGVRWSTTLRFLCDALNSATSAFAGPSVAWRAQKCTVPVALTPNVFDEGEESDELLLHAAPTRATAAATPNVSALFLGSPRISHTSTVRGLCSAPGRAANRPGQRAAFAREPAGWLLWAGAVASTPASPCHPGCPTGNKGWRSR